MLPEQTVAEQDADFGTDLFARDPGACCARAQGRPAAPRPRAATSSGSPGCAATRRPPASNTPLIEWDERNGLVKVNPLAAWSFDELHDYAAAHSVVP